MSPHWLVMNLTGSCFIFPFAFWKDRIKICITMVIFIGKHIPTTPHFRCHPGGGGWGGEVERKVVITSGRRQNQKKNVPVPQERQDLALVDYLKNHYSWIVIGSDLKRPCRFLRENWYLRPVTLFSLAWQSGGNILLNIAEKIRKLAIRVSPGT